MFAVVFGLADFSTVPPTTALARTAFPDGGWAIVLGLIGFAHQVGSALGGAIGGGVYDATGGYGAFFVGAAATCVAAGVPQHGHRPHAAGADPGRGPPVVSSATRSHSTADVPRSGDFSRGPSWRAAFRVVPGDRRSCDPPRRGPMSRSTHSLARILSAATPAALRPVADPGPFELEGDGGLPLVDVAAAVAAAARGLVPSCTCALVTRIGRSWQVLAQCGPADITGYHEQHLASLELVRSGVIRTGRHLVAGLDSRSARRLPPAGRGAG